MNIITPMATITFKTKIRNNGLIPVPVFQRRYCDLSAFRQHPKYGAVANSDLFMNALARIRRDTIGSDTRDYLWQDKLPSNVTVDCSGFLATVTITV